MCEHHLLPIIGRVHVAYIPDGKVVGLSKIPRVVHYMLEDCRIQEQMTEQIARCLGRRQLSLRVVAVVVHARTFVFGIRGRLGRINFHNG